MADTTPTRPLTWESAENDEPGDQNATSATGPHNVYSLGPDWPTGWSVVLIERDEYLDETSYVEIGRQVPTEAQTKALAEAYETTHVPS